MTKTLKFSALLFLVLSLFVLVGGGAPKDPTEAKTKMEEAGYSVTVDGTFTPAGMRTFGVDGAKSVVTAYKGKTDTEEASTLFAVYFESKDAATASIEKLKEWNTNNGKDTNVQQSGQWLFSGDSAAIKAFK